MPEPVPGPRQAVRSWIRRRAGDPEIRFADRRSNYSPALTPELAEQPDPERSSPIATEMTRSLGLSRDRSATSTRLTVSACNCTTRAAAC